MTCPRVGHINFLNVLPLTWSYAHGAADGLQLTRGVPAELNSDIVNHRLDVSNVSSIVYARHSEELVVVPDVCVSTDGDVESILLASRKPIESLKDDKIILTAKSATSHCLLKIILRLAYGAIPNYYVRHITPEDPIPDDATASLLIGDDALWLYHHPREGYYYYDLGLEWKKMTGKKMVYALWVASRRFAESHPESARLRPHPHGLPDCRSAQGRGHPRDPAEETRLHLRAARGVSRPDHPLGPRRRLPRRPQDLLQARPRDEPHRPRA